MLKRVLTYFLLALIVLQSGMSMGDTHQLHQSSSEHVTFDEAHQHLGVLEVEKHDVKTLTTDTSASSTLDCHHCCHGHAHFCPAILVSTDQLLLTKSSSPVSFYSESAFPNTFETILRPPKA